MIIVKCFEWLDDYDRKIYTMTVYELNPKNICLNTGSCKKTLLEDKFSLERDWVEQTFSLQEK